ncbi:MAG: hypothetical protein JO199_13930, partial [Candidatus Eremiobacteraeota bacterium]|nr:hypothetical protein [Candidatus Eremiobacteraeota bacterium]
MNGLTVRAIGFFCIVALAACSGGSMGQNALPATGISNVNGAAPQILVTNGRHAGFIPFVGPNPVRRVCQRPVLPTEMECLSLVRVDLPANAVVPDGKPAYGFGADDLEKAYNAPVRNGAGQLIAIVDAYGYPSASSDLAYYRKTYGLPPCTEASHCLTIRNGAGGATLPAPTGAGWDYEQALDLDMVSAMCPRCRILLLQATNTEVSSLFGADVTAANMGASVV